MKNQFPLIFNWQSNDPSLTYLPSHFPYGSQPSGNAGGVMTSTNTIYSQIVNVNYSRLVGLEVDWSSNPVGVFSILGSNSGNSFFTLTFGALIAQPAGSSGKMGIDLTVYPFTYLMLKYVNGSGSGVLNVYGQVKE